MPDGAEAKVQTFRRVALLREGTRARSAVLSVLYEEGKKEREKERERERERERGAFISSYSLAVREITR